MTHLDDNVICDPAMRVAETTHRKFPRLNIQEKLSENQKIWMCALKKINECMPRVNETQFCVFRRVSSRWVA